MTRQRPRLMKLLASVYGGGVRVRNRLYDRGTLKQSSLQGPVVSIGNLSVGGSGKTPFVILLGGLLKQKGIKFDVLSRGYGRRTTGPMVVKASGTADHFGDEPLLIARSLGVPVVVGEDRFQAGQLAEKAFGPQLHLLDDGFQHRALARDFDIVLLSPEDLDDELLPAGRLRERLSSLSRAEAVVLTTGAPVDSVLTLGKIIWRVHRGISVKNAPARPVAFCGIARPQNFFMQLCLAGVQPAAEAAFRDHHPYKDRDIEDLLKLQQKSEADGFVTTEKDEINLGPHITALQPLTVIPVQMALADAANAVDTMLRIVHERKPGA
ncbi:MAG: tetraacyldisaccharide 4'-kinase [Acidobacteriaceae bacterium]|nr:tetraacyldisaccharide 4'-kinase [Acidobacteriaceae bacterium]